MRRAGQAVDFGAQCFAAERGPQSLTVGDRVGGYFTARGERLIYQQRGWLELSQQLLINASFGAIWSKAMKS